MAHYSIVKYDGYATTNSIAQNIVPMVTIDGYDLNAISDNYVVFLNCTCLALSRNGSVGGGIYGELIFSKLDGRFINEDVFAGGQTAGILPPNAIIPRYDQDTGTINIDVVGPSSADHCQLQMIVEGKVFAADDFT